MFKPYVKATGQNPWQMLRDAVPEMLDRINSLGFRSPDEVVIWINGEEAESFPWPMCNLEASSSDQWHRLMCEAQLKDLLDICEKRYPPPLKSVEIYAAWKVMEGVRARIPLNAVVQLSHHGKA